MTYVPGIFSREYDYYHNGAATNLLPKFNYAEYELAQFNNMLFHFKKMNLNNNNIKNIDTNKLNLNEFHNKYKKLLNGSLMPVSMMRNHPIFSSFISVLDLQMQVDELRKENIELKKQLSKLKN